MRLVSKAGCPQSSFRVCEAAARTSQRVSAVLASGCAPKTQKKGCDRFLRGCQRQPPACCQIKNFWSSRNFNHHRTKCRTRQRIICGAKSIAGIGSQKVKACVPDRDRVREGLWVKVHQIHALKNLAGSRASACLRLHGWQALRQNPLPPFHDQWQRKPHAEPHAEARLSSKDQPRHDRAGCEWAASSNPGLSRKAFKAFRFSTPCWQISESGQDMHIAFACVQIVWPKPFMCQCNSKRSSAS